RLRKLLPGKSLRLSHILVQLKKYPKYSAPLLFSPKVPNHFPARCLLWFFASFCTANTSLPKRLNLWFPQFFSEVPRSKLSVLPKILGLPFYAFPKLQTVPYILRFRQFDLQPKYPSIPFDSATHKGLYRHLCIVSTYNTR